MKKNPYLYLGDKIGRKVYYAIDEDNFYWGKGVQSNLLPSLIAFCGIVFYAFTKNLKFSELNYNQSAFVICSAAAGIVLSVIAWQYGIKSSIKYFSAAEPIEFLPEEQLVKILRQAKQLTVLYHISRFFLAVLLLFAPFLIREEKNVVLFLTYFIVWFAFGALMQMNLKKRRNVLKKIYKASLEKS